MHSDTLTQTMLTARGISCLPKPPGDPARQTSGRTLDHVARVYDLIEPLMMFGLDAVIRREVITLLALKGSEKILDVGCGTGTLTRQIARTLSDTDRSCVVGVDAATAMIDVARRKAETMPNVAFESTLAEQLPFGDGSFDCAVSTMFFHHINADLKCRALNEIWRTLVPGGKTIIVDITPPTNWFGSICVWAGYFLFQQAEIRENIEGKLETAFTRSKFRQWHTVAHHAGYVSVYVLEK